MKEKDFLATLDQQQIMAAIASAEKETSGEIRVHVQPTVRGAEIRTVAEKTFERLGMTGTALRNGVLLFVVCDEQRFVILGDRGINEKVPAGFWDDIAARLTIRFKAGEFTDGVVEAIRSAGEQLKLYFPRVEGDINELTNQISVDR